MGKRGSFVTDILASGRARYRLTADASVSVGIRRYFKERRKERKGEGAKEREEKGRESKID